MIATTRSPECGRRCTACQIARDLVEADDLALADRLDHVGMALGDLVGVTPARAAASSVAASSAADSGGPESR